MNNDVKNNSKQNIAKHIFRLALFAMWVCLLIVIFYFSSQEAEESTRRSVSVGKAVCSIIIKDFDKLTDSDQYDYAHSIDHFIRKQAHFCEYMLLGMLTLNAFYVLFVMISRKSDRFRAFKEPFPVRSVTALIFCAIYAASDELHQYFVPGRFASPKDVLLDTLGALTGIAILILIWQLSRKLKSKKRK